MKRHLYILLLALALSSAAGVSAQTPSPTPTPVPDRQNVNPADLKGVPAVAPGYQSNDRTLPDLGRVGVDLLQQRSLTLSDALELALEHNKDVDVTRENIRIAEFDLKTALGFYEPKFSGQSYFERTRTPVFSFFAGGPDFSLTQTNLVANAGVNGQIRSTGATYNVQFNNDRNTTNNLFTSVNPTYTSSLAFNITQPLLRGRKFDQGRRTIEIAKKNLDLTDSQFRQKTIDTVSAVQHAYWDLTFALRNLQVQRDSLRDAHDQLDHNRRLVNEGQLAPIDVVAAETQVANFEQAVYDALNTVNSSENILKNLISPNRNDPVWSVALTPIDSVDLETPTTTLPEAMDLALQNRPELDINNAQKDLNAIDQKFYREQHKPQIDLVGSYTQTGAAGAINPNFVNPLAASNTSPTLNQVIANVNTITATSYPGLPQIATVPNVTTPPFPDYLTGGYGTALANLDRYPSFRVGVQINFPLLGDKATKAQLGRSLVEGERLQTQRDELEQSIQIDVRNALQAIRTADARLRSAAIARENSQKEYESEQRKLDEGQSDIYQVLERQTALATAKSNELRARTELNKAIADLEHATGNSLKANNIEPKTK